MTMKLGTNIPPHLHINNICLTPKNCYKSKTCLELVSHKHKHLQTFNYKLVTTRPLIKCKLHLEKLNELDTEKMAQLNPDKISNKKWHEVTG